jgi:hypothetical protein
VNSLLRISWRVYILVWTLLRSEHSQAKSVAEFGLRSSFRLKESRSRRSFRGRRAREFMSRPGTIRRRFSMRHRRPLPNAESPAVSWRQQMAPIRADGRSLDASEKIGETREPLLPSDERAVREVRCRACQKRLLAKDEWFGHTVRCPICSALMTLAWRKP